MKAHIIENGVVVNTIEVDSLDFMPNLVEATEGSIGWLYDGQTLTNPAPAVVQINYKTQRAKEYPLITDYIDGIVKGDQTQVQAYIDACLAVKAKYPKG
jgi:hypothetical protein